MFKFSKKTQNTNHKIIIKHNHKIQLATRKQLATLNFISNSQIKFAVHKKELATRNSQFATRKL